MATATVEQATAIEAEADEYPDEAGEILLEAARAWREAGRPERADELLGRVIDGGGDDACYARVEKAEALLADGEVDAARAELARLAADPALHHGHCQMAAEMLAVRGDDAASATWYDRGAARLTDKEIEGLRGPTGFAQLAASLLQGRFQVRRQLGLPADTLDEITPVPPAQRRAAPVSIDDLDYHLATGQAPQQVRMLVFQRDERAEAQRRWPDDYDQSDGEYYPLAERRYRALAAKGLPSIRIVPAIVAELCEFAEREGGSPLDPATRRQYCGAVAGSRMLVWPPARNGPCWCGSTAKYKKCCGRP